MSVYIALYISVHNSIYIYHYKIICKGYHIYEVGIYIHHYIVYRPETSLIRSAPAAIALAATTARLVSMLIIQSIPAALIALHTYIKHIIHITITNIFVYMSYI